MKIGSLACSLTALFYLSTGTVLSGVFASCDSQPGAESTNESGPRTAASLADEPIDGFQEELLDIAFAAVTAMPVNPHIKNRSRGQEAVVAACLALDQPRRALGYIEKIDNWRRGAGYADLAFYCARRDDLAEVQPLLDLARHVSETAEGRADGDETADDGSVEVGSPGSGSGQAWRIDRIRAKIAVTHLWLGQTRQAAEYETGLADSESGTVHAVKGKLLDASSFDEHIQAVDGVVATGTFELMLGTLESTAHVFDRFYEDEERRSRVEEKLERLWERVPVMVRIESMMELAGFALDHEDRVKALGLVERAQGLLDGAAWTPEYYVPLKARLAGLRHRAGEEEQGRSEADAARALFDAERDRIANFSRAGALRPLAEAYQSMGDTAAALALYKRAVEDGAENPNSRPRAEDLSATCCSMALHGVEPDADLLALMHQIHEALGSPW